MADFIFGMAFGFIVGVMFVFIDSDEIKAHQKAIDLCEAELKRSEQCEVVSVLAEQIKHVE